MRATSVLVATTGTFSLFLLAVGSLAEPTSDSGNANAIRPFHVKFSDTELADLRKRIGATKWPERETVKDDTQGVQLDTLQKLARYWEKNYDLRRVEAKLNSLPQFVTKIDGLDIHFIHVRSKQENAMPLVITHGWPGSVVEMLKVIDPLTNPTAHGGKASDAFDVVIRSLPGYGFSGKPSAPGWGPEHIARAWTVLMKRLSDTRFVTQGGDWGDMVTEMMAKQAPPELLGIHTNMPATVPADVSKAIASGGPMPAGLAAWMLDHDPASYRLIARAFDGHPGGLSRDDVLDNITLYWLTNTGISSARLYWENKFPFFDVKGVTIPVAVSVFPDELYQAPRSWAERAFPKLIHYRKLDKGGHFAAWEQPELFVSELRDSFQPLRRGQTLGTLGSRTSAKRGA